MELPASITAPAPEQITNQPRERQQPPPQTTNKAAGVAYMADNILRGFAKGRQAAIAKKTADATRTVNGMQYAYNTAKDNLYKTVKAKIDSGADPKVVMNDPEVKQAEAARDASWASWMKAVGGMVNAQDGGPKKEKKSKKSSQQQPTNPIEGLHSNDPNVKAQTWYQIAAKAGPPDRFNVQELLTPRATADRGTLDTEAQNTQTLARNEARYNELQQKARQPIPVTGSKINFGGPADSSDTPPQPNAMPPQQEGSREAGGVGAGATPPKSNLSDAEQREMQSLQESLERAGKLKPGIGGGDVHGAARLGKPTLGTQVPENALGTDGQPLKIDPNETYTPLFYANGVVRWQAFTTSKQMKTTAGPGGSPEQVNYDPIRGDLDKQHPLGTQPVKKHIETIHTVDENQNPVDKVIQVTPEFSGGHATTTNKGPETFGPHGHYARDENTGATPPTTGTSHPPLSKHQEGAVKQAEKSAHEAGAPAHDPLTFQHYSKDVQGKYNAIRAQELTLNGKPGTSDIGLKASTLQAMDNPETAKKVAVAMKALDVHSKAALSSHNDGDYNYISYLKDNWYNIPGLQEAFHSLDADPAGKVYLDNFFRAWTNAASIRALQGTSGRPSQNMYAMLVNELPMIGVNVSTKEDAQRKMEMLQNDVDTASETLPESAKKSLTEFKSHGRGPTAPHTAPAAHPEVDSILDSVFGKPK